MASDRSGFNLFDEIFSLSAMTRTPAGVVAESCLRGAAAGLAADSDATRVGLGEALDGATIKTAPTGEQAVAASVAVQGSKLAFVRDNVAIVRAELAGQFAHTGWTLTGLNVVAAEVAAGPAARPSSPPKKHELANALAEAIAGPIKSYDVAAACDRLGMAPHPDPDADPFRSKRIYVLSRLQPADVDEIAAAARHFLDDYDDEHLEGLLDRLRRGGHKGAVKNLIFGSTRKPDLVLTDALSNDLGLVNKEEALLYDAGIPEEGLSWCALVTELLPQQAAADLRAAGLVLYNRLKQCLASEAERNLFLVYAERYKALGFEVPALIPQVWLHYDPRSESQRDGKRPLVRQRMDFLLLLAGRRRVVLEVDGVQHYSDSDKPSPRKYAEMVRADRELRLAGYEVYRFGGAELMDVDGARAVVGPFIDQLLTLR